MLLLSTEGKGWLLMEKSNIDVASLPILKDEFTAAVESSVSENIDGFEDASTVLVPGLKLNVFSAKKSLLVLLLFDGESKENGACLLELWSMQLVPTCGESKLNAEVVDGESKENDELFRGEVLSDG